MRSHLILEQYKRKFAETCSLPLSNKNDRIRFLRHYLALLNEFLYERRPLEEIEELNQPYEGHPEWKRITPFLSIWDDYAELVLGFSFDETQIRKLAAVFVDIFAGCPKYRQEPVVLPPDSPAEAFGGLAPKEFALIRLMHALQDFSQLLPAIDQSLVSKIRAGFGGIPDEHVLADEEAARKLLGAFGGADRNVEERLRYIFSSARIIESWRCEGAFGLAKKCNLDAREIFKKLVQLPGLKSKKAYMILRDYYEMGIWRYEKGIEDINIIADNRVMRVALRTGIIRTAMGKLLNSLLDQFDFQYVLTVAATEEAFRKVWEATKDLNGGKHVVSYPARFDEVVFRLGDGRSGCCKPNKLACRTSKKPPTFSKWLLETFSYQSQQVCPFQEVCEEFTKDIQAPFAIQNRTWIRIFTGKGGGGGLRGV